MAIAAPVYQPQLQVTLHKLIQRKSLNGSTLVSTRAAATSASYSTIDLTRAFMVDGSALRTSKGLRDPAGGFSVQLIDAPFEYAGTFESMYGLIEPMDVIEIRLRHAPPTEAQKLLSTYYPTKPNIIMRGFVSDVSRSETMGPDGRPQRRWGRLDARRTRTGKRSFWRYGCVDTRM